MSRPVRTVAAVACAFAVTLAACGDDDGDSTAASDATESETSAPADTEPADTEPAETEPPATEPPATEATTTEPADTTTSEAATTTTEAEPALGSIVDVATEAGQFTTLLAAAEAAGLTEALASGDITLLAPTDDAFAALGQPTIDALLADPEALSAVLQGHVLPVPQNAETISIFKNVLAINGASWDVVVDGDTLRIGPATVVTADIEADNGIIHAIDVVLVPPPAAEG